MRAAHAFRDHGPPPVTFGSRKGMSRAVVLVSVLLALANCRPEGETASDFPRSESVYVGGRIWGEVTTFNPLTAVAWPIEGIGLNLLYETLFAYDWFAGKLEPLLAQSYEVFPDRVEVTMNPAAR